eukprot:Gb_14511 [translate_table: standard]
MKRYRNGKVWDFELEMPMRPKNSKVLLGFDRSTTSTVCIRMAMPFSDQLPDPPLLLARSIVRGSNHNSIGEIATRETLEQVMAEALMEFSSNRYVVQVVCLTVSSVNHVTDQHRILKWLRDIFRGNVKLFVHNDVVTALASGTTRKLYGCLLIVGTGTITYGLTEDGREARATVAWALTHLCDVLPSSYVVVVHYGAMPYFCARFLTIEYKDLAKQSLQALEKISHEHPIVYLCADSLADHEPIIYHVHQGKLSIDHRSILFASLIPPEYWNFIELQDTYDFPSFLEATDSDTQWLFINPLEESLQLAKVEKCTNNLPPSTDLLSTALLCYPPKNLIPSNSTSTVLGHYSKLAIIDGQRKNASRTCRQSNNPPISSKINC